MSDAEKQIREAATETRPGEWRVSKHHESRYTLIYDADGFEVARVCYPNRDANAQFIAACNPAAIRELLAERDALKVDAERYRWLRGGKEIPAHSVRWARWDVRQWCGGYWYAMFAEQMDAAIDAARGIT